MEREGDAGAVILRLLHSLIASDRINRDKFEGLKIRDGDEGESRGGLKEYLTVIPAGASNFHFYRVSQPLSRVKVDVPSFARARDGKRIQVQ